MFVETHEKENVKENEQLSWKRSREFGMSLVLSNVVPMSPKLINGSYAAFFDNMVEFAKVEFWYTYDLLFGKCIKTHF